MNSKRFSFLTTCISVLLIIGLVGPASLMERASSTAIAAPVDFSDVATDYWAFSAIRTLTDREIVNGFPDGSFKPENNVTRAEFAKIIGLTLGYSPDASAPQKFPDLASTHWAFGYVATAVSHGLIVGYPDGSFKPERSVTKAEILTVIARAKGWSSSGGDHFIGLPSDHWACQSIEACYQNGVVRNPDPYIVSEGNLLQDDPATRAQTCVFTDRMLSTSEQVTALIQAGQGGVIQLPDGAGVSIPANSLVADAKVTLRTIPASSVPNPGGLEPVSVGCEVDLGGVALKSPLTVSFPAPASSEGLLVARFNGEFWEPLGGGLDTTTNRITGQSLANSIFSLVRLKPIQTGFSMEQHSYHVANSMPSQKETFLGWCYGMAATAGYGVFPSYSTPPKPQKASPTLDDLNATWQNYIKGTNAQQISEWGSWSSTLLALQQKRYSLNSSNSEVVLAAFRSISFGQFLYAMSKNHPIVLGLLTDYEIPSPTTITNLLNSLPVLLWNSSNPHAILAYGLQLTPNPTILVYDPNLPDQPQRISFDSIAKWIALGTPFYSPTYKSGTFQFTHFAPSWPPPTVGKPPLLPSPSPMPNSTGWNQLFPTNSPSARCDSAMTYAPNVGKILLFGGGKVSPINFQDIWAYDPISNSWQALTPSGDIPPPRIGHSMVYAPSIGKVVLFGGWEWFSGALEGTWTYDPVSNVWQNMNPPHAPPPRYAHEMVYMDNVGKVILFGGSPASALRNDTWAYDPVQNDWTNLAPSNPPPARAHLGMAYDKKNGQVVLFGGLKGDGWLNGLNDTWLFNYSANNWVQLHPTISPSPRGGHSMCWGGSNAIVMFGGPANSSPTLNDTWLFNTDSHEWVNLNLSNLPPAREFACLVSAENTGSVILFGGRKEYRGSYYFNDTWTLTLDEFSSLSLTSPNGGAGWVSSGLNHVDGLALDPSSILYAGTYGYGLFRLVP